MTITVTRTGNVALKVVERNVRRVKPWGEA